MQRKYKNQPLHINVRQTDGGLQNLLPKETQKE